MKKRLIVGISGGSGIPLATELLSRLQKIEEIETHLVYTRGAEITAAQESELSMGEICALADVVYDNKDIGAAKLQKEYMTQSGSLRMEKAVRRTFCVLPWRIGEFCAAGRFLPVLPQSVVYYKKWTGKWAAKVILERRNIV